MKKFLVPTGAVLLLALIVTGCESDGSLSGRTQEKSAVYATLKPWQKKYIDKGTIAVGFSPDMVYMAMGNPTTKDVKDVPQGRVELWTYDRYYPPGDALHGFQRARFTAESAYQPQAPTMQTDITGGAPSNGVNSRGQGGAQVPRGMDTGGGESIGKTGGPQGGSMEPADLQSYSVQGGFEGGRVVKMGAVPNVN